jgi:hypothetical protein
LMRGSLASCWRQARQDSKVEHGPNLPQIQVLSAEATELDVESVEATKQREDVTKPRVRVAKDRKCAYCDLAFTPRRQDATYCGRSCRNMASRKRVKGKRKAA